MGDLFSRRGPLVALAAVWRLLTLAWLIAPFLHNLFMSLLSSEPRLLTIHVSFAGDETRPLCLRCTRAGRRCEGYAQSKTWLFEPTTNTPPAATGDELVPSFNKSNPIHFFEDSAFNRATQYFLECTAPRIASYFAEMMDSFVDNKAVVTYSSQQACIFWNNLVIQASETNACVRHSLTALSSLHEWLDVTKRTPWQNQTFATHYAKAIAEINQSQGKLPLDIILISCLLFAHCDFLMGASAAGLTHLKSGHRIISENRKQQVQVSSDISQLIEPIIEGFIAKSANYQLKEITAPGGDPSEETIYALPEMPEVFEDLSEANKHIQQALYWAIIVELGQPHHTSTIAPGIRRYVADWATAFSRWKASSELDDPLLRDWQLLLLAHHRMVLLILKAVPPENDTNYARGAADFRIMFAQLCTFLRAGYTDLDPNNSGNLVLEVHLGFITPLFFIATRCPVREIRYNALKALKDLNVVEGHWNSCVAYAIAKTAVEIEERGATTHPLRASRIKIDSVDRAKDGSLSMKYHTVPGSGSASHAATARIAEPACHHELNMQWVCMVVSAYKSSVDI